MKKSRAVIQRASLVRMAVDLLEHDINPRYRKKMYLKKLKIHENPQDRYYKQFINLADYLIELRGAYKNPIKELMKDYFLVIYKRFEKFGRIPSLSNLSPSVANKVAFEEYIYNLASQDEEFWYSEIVETPEVIHVPIVSEDIEIDASIIEV